MLDENSVAGMAVVIGAGTMGGGIAAQLANAGWTVHLLDISLDAAVAGLERVKSARPPLLFVPDFADRITPGVFPSGPALNEADWIVEAVAEKMPVKQSVMAVVEEHARPDGVVSSNTSGLSLRTMVESRSPAFQSRFLGSHFLNPPRYLKLLEVIPIPQTAPDIGDGFVRFAEQVLGHRVVLAKDTPGFISTRLGIWHVLDTIRLAIDHGMGVEQADALTGPLIGRPKSGTFRMADLVGLDILAAIGSDQYARLPDDPFRDSYKLPKPVTDLIAAGRTGEKSGGGFYKRDGKTILTFDFEMGDYRPRREVVLPVGDAVARLPLAERFAALQAHRDEPGMSFLNDVLDSVGRYVGFAGPRIADDVLSIDRVMCWGFGWEMGPYETIDARSTGEARRTAPECESDAPYYSGQGSGRRHRQFGKVDYAGAPREPEYMSLAAIKGDPKAIVLDSPQATVADLGDGVACLEFHTKMNTFSPELTAFVDRARERAEADFRALVIANDASHFSAGYNLKLFLEARAAGDWLAIDGMLHDCQYAFMRLKYAKIPVVGAPHGYTLGAGCECSLHCHALQAAPELYMGLPEANVGVVPAGGGTTEMLVRAMSVWDGERDPFDMVVPVFDLLAFPRNSTSAEDARRLGFLRSTDRVSHNADRQLYEAKQLAVELAARYSTPERPRVHVTGEEGHARLHARIDEKRAAGAITEYDAFMADAIARILSGSSAREVDEDDLLRLEREVFIEVVREEKSGQRLEHVLATGKPLRN
jgi:3-hydroxyacyl-CoA dehydrogenase